MQVSRSRNQKPSNNERANAANAAAVERIVSGTVDTPAQRRMTAATNSRPGRGSSEYVVPSVKQS